MAWVGIVFSLGHISLLCSGWHGWHGHIVCVLAHLWWLCAEVGDNDHGLQDGRTDRWSDSLTALKAAGLTPWRHVSVGVTIGEEEETSATCYWAHSIKPSDLLGKSKILNRANVTHLVKIPLRPNEKSQWIHNQNIWENKPNLAEMCGMSSVVAWGEKLLCLLWQLILVHLLPGDRRVNRLSVEVAVFFGFFLFVFFIFALS